MRVVFDTNVLISALLWPRRAPASAVGLARHGRVRSLVSKPLLDEFRQVLQEKLRFEPGVVERAIEILVDHSETIEPRHALHVVKADPDDDRVLECALEGKADIIVTGDRHLLALKSFQGIPIITIREFLEQFSM